MSTELTNQHSIATSVLTLLVGN